MAPKALMFDLDGTISDTHSIHLANWLEVLRPYGIDVDMDLYQNTLNGQYIEEVVEGVLPDLSEEEKQRFLKREAESYRIRMMQTGLITGLGDLLE